MSHPDFLAQVRKGEAVRKAEHLKEAQRQRFSGFGCDLGPFVPRTEAQLQAEANERLASWSSPEAVLVRELLTLEAAGVVEASRIYSAYWREEADWADRARALIAAQTQVAA